MRDEDRKILAHIEGEVGSVVRFTFDCMGVAEEELKKAEASAAFPLLCPTPLLVGKSLNLYRSHARELIARFKAKEDTRPGTDAECLTALLHGALKAPLDSTAAALAERLFRGVFDADEVRRLGLGEAPREPWPGASDELLTTLRRKLRVEERKVWR